MEWIASVQLPSVFNPYSDTCPHFDMPDAAKRRRRNLQAQLSAAIEGHIDTIWIARDLGYRGGRRTGLALTDEANLANVALAYRKSLPISRATKGPLVAERTAAVIWRMMQRLERPVFTWNVFPFHPHLPEDQLTNRCHTAFERAGAKPILITLLDMLRPENIVAIGNEAELGLHDLGVKCRKVRHPSYGGVTDFERGLMEIHGESTPAIMPSLQARLL